MKVSEVRNLISGYSPDQLRVIIAELYKAIPKAVKEDHDVDGILRNPTSAQSRARNKGGAIPNIRDLEDEANRFIEAAYGLCYLVPNRTIPKRERPKWRFTVKRLYKGLLAAADQSSVPEAARLLEKIYELLCYSCRYTLFSAYDSFESIGVEQDEFFRRLLGLKYQCEDKNAFVRNALLLMAGNALNRYTLREDLMWVVLEFLQTPDLREMAVAKCSELTETMKGEPPSEQEHQSRYEKREKLNSLTKMAFLCYARLYEYEQAISYFKVHYCVDNDEVALYVLLRLLSGLNQTDYFMQEYERALENGIIPRDSLKRTYRFAKENGKLPATPW